MESEISHSFTVDRVYEFATDIASEFENVVNVCGIELLKPVILKVINALEHLESTLLTLESSKKDILDLRNENQQLLTKTTSSKNERVKLEQDLEELQEHTDNEISQLNFTIKILRENYKLLQDSHKRDKSEKLSEEVVENFDKCLIESLKNAISSLTLKLEEKDFKLQEMTDKIVKFQAAVEELSSANKVLCSKVFETEKQLKNVYKNESELKRKISEQDKALKILEESLNEAVLQKLDFEESYSGQSNPSSLISEETDIESPVDLQIDKSSELDKEALIIKIQQLEGELLRIKNDSENFQLQYLQLKDYQAQQKLSNRSSSIRQLFHFLFGILVPVSGNFR